MQLRGDELEALLARCVVLLRWQRLAVQDEATLPRAARTGHGTLQRMARLPYLSHEQQAGAEMEALRVHDAPAVLVHHVLHCAL